MKLIILLKNGMHRKAVIHEVIKRYRCIFLSMYTVLLFFPNYSCHKIRMAGVEGKLGFLEVKESLMMLSEVKWQWESLRTFIFVLHLLNYLVIGQKKAHFLFGICVLASSGTDQIPLWGLWLGFTAVELRPGITAFEINYSGLIQH